MTAAAPKALFERMAVCGPVIDPPAASRARSILLEAAVAGGWPDHFEIAWPALAPIFAASPYLAGLARRWPDDLGEILGADPADLATSLVEQAAASPIEPIAATERRLRRLKAKTHLLVALADLGGCFDLESVTGALSQFADAALRAAFAAAAREALAADRTVRLGEGDEGPIPGLFCVAMGKLGAFELNYSSDIDICVFYEPQALPLAAGVESAALAIRLTERVADLLRRRTSDGYVFRVDLRLRPDPSSTPAAVSVPAAFEYYESVGQNWERAAFIKARAVAGDVARGKAFLCDLEPFVWRRNLDFAAIADIHSIRRELHGHNAGERLNANGADLKLGRGGIREIEFYAQTQQLILGGRRPDLRSRSTLTALEALGASGHAPKAATVEMAGAYRDLRRLEHLVQMIDDEQVHRLPQSDRDRRRIAALAGAVSLRRFDADVRALLHKVDRRCHELFASEEPQAPSFGSLMFTGVDDDPETTRTLRRMGFTEPAKVLAQIRAWRHGRIAATRTERGREAFTRLAPRLLEAASETGAADAAFARFSDFFSRLTSGVQVQALFLAKPRLLELIVRIMALAPQFARTLALRPAALDTLLDPALFSPGLDQGSLTDAVAAAESFEGAMDIARRLHGEASFRIAVQVLEAIATAEAAGLAFAALADAVISGLAQASLDEVVRKAGAFQGDVAVVALGKCGSSEMTVRSDLDLMTLYRGAPEAVSSVGGWSAETFFARFTQRLVAALSAPTAQGELYEVDLQLRPSGTKGPVSVSMAALETYYAGEAEVWELLAMTRARVVWATSPRFALDAAQAIETALRRRRDTAATARDVRAMRELMDSERPATSLWDMKLSRGGLVDIEFCAQYLQLVLAADGGPLRQNTLEALAALSEAAVASTHDLDALANAFRLQQNLSQLLKVALPDGADPAKEPYGLKTLVARAAEVRSFAGVAPKLVRARKAARRAFDAILASDGTVFRRPGARAFKRRRSRRPRPGAG